MSNNSRAFEDGQRIGRALPDMIPNFTRDTGRGIQHALFMEERDVPDANHAFRMNEPIKEAPSQEPWGSDGNRPATTWGFPQSDDIKVWAKTIAIAVEGSSRPKDVIEAYLREYCSRDRAGALSTERSRHFNETAQRISGNAEIADKIVELLKLID